MRLVEFLGVAATQAADEFRNQTELDQVLGSHSASSCRRWLSASCCAHRRRADATGVERACWMIFSRPPNAPPQI